MRIFNLFTLMFLIQFIAVLFAQDSTSVQNLEVRVKRLEDQLQQEEIEKLKREAENTVAQSKEEKDDDVSKSRQQSLQALNPEISVIGDFYGQYLAKKDGFDEESRSGSFLRVFGLHFRSDLDPFSFMKAALEWGAEGAEVAEAYVTYTNFMQSVTFTAGKFKQQFGVVNRWHEHALDQFDAPAALADFFGEEGLLQSGLSLDWLMPSITGGVNLLTVQVTNSENGPFFAGEFFSTPAYLVHFKNFYDIDRDNYIELGLSGLTGTNHSRYYDENSIKVKESNRNSIAAGFDFTYLWEPVRLAKYRSFTWRTEGFYIQKNLPEDIELNRFGGFSYLQYKLNERLSAGCRVDYLQPTESATRDKYLFQIVPYLTWMQSEWVIIRMQYNYSDGTFMDKSDQRITLQLNWAAGPHIHERY